MNFLFIWTNIRTAPAYGVYTGISQLIRYSRACGFYNVVLDRGLLLTKDSLWLWWKHHYKSIMVATITWLTITEYLCHKWRRICPACCNHNSVLSSLMTYHRICSKRKRVLLEEKELVTYPEDMGSPPGFVLSSCCQIVGTSVVLCRSLSCLFSWWRSKHSCFLT